MNDSSNLFIYFGHNDERHRQQYVMGIVARGITAPPSIIINVGPPINYRVGLENILLHNHYMVNVDDYILIYNDACMVIRLRA